MYAIAQIIYGYPLVSNDTDVPSARTTNELIDQALVDEEDGFLEYYSGASDEEPVAFGIELGAFDEACAFVALSSLPTSPTAEQLAEFQANLDKLDAHTRSAIVALGEPSVFFLWSTS